MTTSELLLILSIVAFVISGVAAVVAVILWFRFGIKDVYGDLSGKTARKSIELARQRNDNSAKSHFPSTTNVKRGPITGMMSETTANIKNQAVTESGKYSEETVPLDAGEETKMLNDVPDAPKMNKVGNGIEIIEEVILIHTNEEI